jgi:hypothetical protein
LANEEVGKWQEVLDIYNDRFSMPFKAELKNSAEIVLKEQAPKVVFSYSDADLQAEQTKEDLFKVLSQGQQRAFYWLQVIFEIEKRKSLKQRSVIICDDVAESFDYRNKYAIVEYLSDLTEVDDFYLIVLTHNFDFYRTVANRIGFCRGQLYFCYRDAERKVQFNRGTYVRDPFSSVICKDIEAQPKRFICAIPFVRNLIEYKDGTRTEAYCKLTSCLHIKEDTGSLSVGEIAQCLSEHHHSLKDIKPNFEQVLGTNNYIKLLDKAAKKVAEDGVSNQMCLEDKLTLSIAIRLLSEIYMLKLLPASSGLKGERTGDLYDRLIKGVKNGKYKIGPKQISVLRQAMICTPESIHINSFMYEPLLDISMDHLIKLYKSCTNELKVQFDDITSLRF